MMATASRGGAMPLGLIDTVDAAIFVPASRSEGSNGGGSNGHSSPKTGPTGSLETAPPRQVEVIRLNCSKPAASGVGSNSADLSWPDIAAPGNCIFLSDPENFAALELVYVLELQQVSHAVMLHSGFSFWLSRI